MRRADSALLVVFMAVTVHNTRIGPHKRHFVQTITIIVGGRGVGGGGE